MPCAARVRDRESFSDHLPTSSGRRVFARRSTRTWILRICSGLLIVSPTPPPPVSASIYHGAWDPNRRFRSSKSFLASLRRRCSFGRASWRRLTTSAFRRPCQSRGRPCAQRHQPPTASSLDLRVCEFSARKSRCSRRARVRNFARVAISRRCRSEGSRIINRTRLARVHRRSHRRTANPVKRIHLPSFPRARAPCAFARHQEAAMTA